LGHDAGDELLREVAQRIAGCVRGQDTVARMGGDEFTVLLPEIGEAAAASTVANKISDVLRTPIDLDGHEVFITSSIGISIAPDDGEEPLVLLRNADLAMYRAKEKGRNNFRYFTEELNQQVNRQLQLETELRIAVEQGQFQMHYQPIYLSDGETIVAFEALLRWQHPNRGLVVPEEFIGALEETGLILDLAEWILQHSCLKAKQLQAQGRRLPMHVNLSARQFHRGDLPTLVARVLKQTALEPSLLYLEITETMLMEDIEQTLESLLTLKKLGVGLAIDDFGSGYSSLNYLKRFPVDVLKVDRSFVRNIPDEPQDMEITAAVIAMAHKLKLKVVAEGVETKEQLGFLRENDCDRVQGYYCSIPTDEDGLDYLLKISPKLHE
jgi:predicted signal transduction protein with EAL and GGDEF domain